MPRYSVRGPCLALFLVASAAASARADTLQTVDDKPFSLSMRFGALYTDDGMIASTWVRPVMFGGTAWIVRGRRHWLDGLQLYGLLGLESASMTYREQPQYYENGLEGIHRADIGIATGLVFGAGVRASLFDDGRFHVSVFGDAAWPRSASSVDVHSLVVDLNGLTIDVAKAARNDAKVTFAGRTYRLGLTGGLSLGSGRVKWIPYLTVGWLRYSADIRFQLDQALKDELARFGVDPNLLAPRAIVEDNPFFAPGLRVDLGRSWSLEAQALFGRYGGTWVSAALAGVAWHFGS